MNLTTREKEIIQSLAKGLGNQSIAKTHNISINTVKFHLQNIYVKLEASNRTQAIFKYNELQKQKNSLTNNIN